MLFYPRLFSLKPTYEKLSAENYPEVFAETEGLRTRIQANYPEENLPDIYVVRQTIASKALNKINAFVLGEEYEVLARGGSLGASYYMETTDEAQTIEVNEAIFVPEAELEGGGGFRCVAWEYRT